MYPRINPKTNAYSLNPRKPLSILEKQRALLNSHDSNDRFHSTDKQNPFKAKTLLQESPSQKKLKNLFQNQNKRGSPRMGQLAQKFNHLRGKRRSLQLALELYQQVPSLGSSSKSKSKGLSMNKLEATYNQNKNDFQLSTLGRLIQTDQSNSRVWKYAASHSWGSESDPLKQICLRETNNLNKKQQTEKHNFIPKPTRKRALFKSRIMDQILQNSIDGWQDHQLEDQNQFKLV